MSKVIECGAIFEGCEGVARAETQDELMSQVMEHVKSINGVTEIDAATAELVGASIRDE